MSFVLKIVRHVQCSPNSLRLRSFVRVTSFSNCFGYRYLSTTREKHQIIDRKSSSTTKELFGAISKNMNSLEFRDILNSLKARKVSFDEIPSEVFETINYQLSHIEKENFHIVVSCLIHLATIGIKASDLNRKVVSVLDTNFQFHLNSQPKELSSAMLALSMTNFIVSPSMLACINKSLYHVSPKANLVSISRSFAVLRITWASLSLEARGAWQKAVLSVLSTYDFEQVAMIFNNLRAMEAAQNSFPILRQPLLNRLNELALSNSEADYSMTFRNWASLMYEFTHCPTPLKQKMEEEFIKLYKADNSHGLHYLNSTNTPFDKFSPEMQTFLKVELPIFLFDEGNSGTFYDRFSRISQWMNWSLFTSADQSKILLTLTNYYTGTDKNNSSIWRKFISMNPKFDDLPVEIGSIVEIVFEFKFNDPNSQVAYYHIDRMNQIGMKFPNLSPKLQESLLISVDRGFSTLTFPNFVLTVTGLSGIGVTSQDLGGNLSNKIIDYALSHQEDISQLDSQRQIALKSSIQSLFSTSN